MITEALVGTKQIAHGALCSVAFVSGPAKKFVFSTVDYAWKRSSNTSCCRNVIRIVR